MKELIQPHIMYVLQQDITLWMALQISEAKFSALGALGAGLLTGTALAVIIPEGFHAFQAAQHATGMHCTALHLCLQQCHMIDSEMGCWFALRLQMLSCFCPTHDSQLAILCSMLICIMGPSFHP